MAKIIKIGSQNVTFTSNSVNQGKTSRQGNATNPFKFSNFEGNTLQFADVFEGFESKKTNNISFKGQEKLRMVATSVTGSMNKMRTGLTESIGNFVNRVREAWDYAANTNISDLPGIKQISGSIRDSVSTLSGAISSRVEMLNSKLSNSRLSYLNTDMKDVWADLVSTVSPSKYSAATPVEELESAWRAINANESMEGAVA